MVKDTKVEYQNIISTTCHTQIQKIKINNKNKTHIPYLNNIKNLNLQKLILITYIFIFGVKP